MKKATIDKNKASQKSQTYHHGDLKQALLKSAEQELAEKSIETFSLRGVAKRAGVSHSAPAYHFIDSNGLLTALAELGFQRLIQSQDALKSCAPNCPKEQLVALGLGYIDFAIKNPALFRLMFSSEKPDITNDKLKTTSAKAFNKLLEDVSHVSSPGHQTSMTDVLATWAIVHGLADLMIGPSSSLTTHFETMNKIERDNTLSKMILRACRIDTDE